MIDVLPKYIPWERTRKIISLINLAIVVLFVTSLLIGVVVSLTSHSSADSYLPLMLVVWAIGAVFAIGLINCLVWVAYMIGSSRNGQRKLSSTNKIIIAVIGAIFLFYLTTYIVAQTT